MDRRRFLGTSGTWLLPFLAGARPALAALRPPRSKNGPRYLVRIHLTGGVDALWTTDPKSRKTVESWVDIPYESKELAEVDGVPLGPHFKAMATWPRQMTILNGVAVSTANHETGIAYATRFRTAATPRTPTLFDVFGSYRDGQPLGSVSLNAGLPEQYSPTGDWLGTASSWFGAFQKDLLAQIDGADPDDLRRMAKVLRREAQSAKGVSSAGDVTARSIDEAAALFERVASIPPFKPETWEGGGVPYVPATLQRALWLIENDLTAGIFANCGQRSLWDSHYVNTEMQSMATPPAVTHLGHFLQALETRRNAYGSLAENTLVVIGSELGRNPRMNEELGKDHFPEAAAVFLGRWFASGDGHWRAFGDTDTRMAARPVDLATGRAARSGGHAVWLDDLGTTLLHIAGIDPELHGYTGSVLPFLLRS